MGIGGSAWLGVGEPDPTKPEGGDTLPLQLGASGIATQGMCRLSTANPDSISLRLGVSLTAAPLMLLCGSLKGPIADGSGSGVTGAGAWVGVGVANEFRMPEGTLPLQAGAFGTTTHGRCESKSGRMMGTARLGSAVATTTAAAILNEERILFV